MGIEKTFIDLSNSLHRLRDRLQEVRLTIVEDRPEKNDAVIVDNFEYAVEDMLGWVNEAIGPAHIALTAVRHPVDVERAREALSTCQERFQRIDQVFSTNMTSYEHLSDLSRFGESRGNDWKGWVIGVKQGIEQCKEPMTETRNQLGCCWQDMAERNGPSVSIRATNIGQKVVGSAEFASMAPGTVSRRPKGPQRYGENKETGG